MKILENKSKLDNLLESIKVKKLNVGLIPTMGSIHKGHLSLVNYSKNIGCFSLATIYINPTQFDDKDDFINYPKNTQEDIEKLSQSGCDALYIPTSNEVYPTGIKSKKTIFEFRNILCDKFRPSHFDGVSTVVDSLFNIVKPDFAFFGEKDFQQLRIIQDMNSQLNYNINIIPCEIIREKNGLAMSSRNEYLNSENREKAKIIFDTLQLGLRLIKNGEKNLSNIYSKLNKKLSLESSISVDYIKIVNHHSLMEFSDIINDNFLICIAVYMENTRLIDNIQYDYNSSSLI